MEKEDERETPGRRRAVDLREPVNDLRNVVMSYVLTVGRQWTEVADYLEKNASWGDKVTFKKYSK